MGFHFFFINNYQYFVRLEKSDFVVTLIIIHLSIIYIYFIKWQLLLCCRCVRWTISRNGRTVTTALYTAVTVRTPADTSADGRCGTPTTTTPIYSRSPVWECSSVPTTVPYPTEKKSTYGPPFVTKRGENRQVCYPAYRKESRFQMIQIGPILLELNLTFIIAINDTNKRTKT